MKRSLYGHTIVAVIMSIAAYVAWTRPKTAESSTVTVVDGSLERLTAVKYDEERWKVAINRTGEEFAVTVQRLNPAPKPKPEKEGAEPKPEPPAPAEPDPPKTFPAAKKVDELLEKLAPLEAARSLGELSGERLAAMGLDDPGSKLTLVFGETPHVIELGNSTYGSGDLYARTASGEVFLLPSASIGSIRHGASALLDKNAVGIERDQVTRVTITAGASGREVAQRYAEDKEKRFFSDPAEPEEKLEMVSNWLERMWRLRVIDLADAPPSVIPPAVEIEMFAGPDSLGVVRLWPPNERVAHATSTRFSQPFTVSKASAEALLKDLEGILTEGR